MLACLLWFNDFAYYLYQIIQIINCDQYSYEESGEIRPPRLFKKQNAAKHIGK